MKGFLWKTDGKNKGECSVAWKNICLQKDQGGLGLKSLHKYIEALMDYNF